MASRTERAAWDRFSSESNSASTGIDSDLPSRTNRRAASARAAPDLAAFNGATISVCPFKGTAVGPANACETAQIASHVHRLLTLDICITKTSFLCQSPANRFH